MLSQKGTRPTTSANHLTCIRHLQILTKNLVHPSFWTSPLTTPISTMQYSSLFLPPDAERWYSTNLTKTLDQDAPITNIVTYGKHCSAKLHAIISCQSQNRRPALLRGKTNTRSPSSLTHKQQGRPSIVSSFQQQLYPIEFSQNIWLKFLLSIRFLKNLPKSTDPIVGK